MEVGESEIRRLEEEDSVFLINLQSALGLSSDEWNCTLNGTVTGRSGLKHKFDFILRSLSGREKLIVCRLLKKGGNNRMGRITAFYAHSVDVASSRAIVISEDRPSIEEQMLTSSLKVEMLLSESLGENTGSKSHLPTTKELEVTAVSSKQNQEKKQDVRRRKYRDRTQIIHEILSSVASSEGSTLTRIIFRCNLNYKTAKEIVDEMIRNELLSREDQEDQNKTVYGLTKLGGNILEKLYFYDSVQSGRSSHR